MMMNTTMEDQEEKLSNLEIETSNYLDMAHESFENLNSSFNSLSQTI